MKTRVRRQKYIACKSMNVWVSHCQLDFLKVENRNVEWINTTEEVPA